MKYTVLLFIVIAFSGCSNDSEGVDTLPYFKFLAEDSDKFITASEPGKILIYKNQNNSELRFKVVKNSTRKMTHIKGNWVYGSTKIFYYDEQKIEMQSTLFTEDDFTGDSSFYISIKRWPTTFNDGANGNPFILSEDSHLIANIGLYPFQTGTSVVYSDYSEPILSITINGTTFTKVRKIAIDPNPSSNPNWPLPELQYIYFDQNKGIIGFDDFQNNEWRLQN